RTGSSRPACSDPNGGCGSDCRRRNPAGMPRISRRGTKGSNPSPSSGESVNHRFRARGPPPDHSTEPPSDDAVDATIINAPSSTKNADKGARSRDASDKEGQPVVFRDEGAFRGKLA